MHIKYFPIECVSDIVIDDVHTSKEKCSEVKDYPGVSIIIPHIYEAKLLFIEHSMDVRELSSHDKTFSASVYPI